MKTLKHLNPPHPAQHGYFKEANKGKAAKTKAIRAQSQQPQFEQKTKAVMMNIKETSENKRGVDVLSGEVIKIPETDVST